jgi:D-alanine-D-alanine ligase
VADELGRQPYYSPDEWLIFNWCEQYYDRPWTDAEIAAELEALGYVFTGAGSQAMRVSLDKAIVRQRLIEAGVPMPAGRIYHTDQVEDWSTFPAIVKPTNQHASYGISRASLVESKAELRLQVQAVLDEFAQPVMVEEFIDGREVHVAMLGNHEIEVLPPLEIDYTLFDERRDRIYTNEAKFDKESSSYHLTKFLCPAPIDNVTQARLADVSRRAYQVVGCRDYGRIDCRLRNGQPYVLDVNPNADLTFESDHAIGSKMLGWNYGRLASRIVQCAAERWPQPAAR